MTSRRRAFALNCAAAFCLPRRTERDRNATPRELSLAELRVRCDLPEFAQWDQYESLHPQNANLTYLRLERLQFE